MNHLVFGAMLDDIIKNLPPYVRGYRPHFEIGRDLLIAFTLRTSVFVTSHVRTPYVVNLKNWIYSVLRSAQNAISEAHCKSSNVGLSDIKGYFSPTSQFSACVDRASARGTAQQLISLSNNADLNAVESVKSNTINGAGLFTPTTH